MLRLAIALTLLLLFASYFPSGCDTLNGGGGDGARINSVETSEAIVTAQAAEVTVAAVRDLGVIRINDIIQKRDCGLSVEFAGRSVWLFGDTLLATPNEDNRTFLSNSWSSTYDTDAGDGIDGFTERVDAVGAPQEFFPLTEAERALADEYEGEVCEEGPCTAHWDMWPGTIIVDQEKGWAYVFYRKVYCERGLFNFHHVGHSIAVWKNVEDSPERPEFDYVDDYPTLFFAEDGEAGFGSAAVLVDKLAYVYGCELGEDELTKPCHLARVPLADILDKSAWRFYAGEGQWQTDSRGSQAIFTGNDMMSVFFNAHLNRYVAVYSEPLAATAMLRTAVRPEGPWSAPLELFSVDAPENVYGWVYDFLAHPEFSQDNGRIIYITYTKKIDRMHSQLRQVAVELDPPR